MEEKVLNGTQVFIYNFKKKGRMVFGTDEVIRIFRGNSYNQNETSRRFWGTIYGKFLERNKKKLGIERIGNLWRIVS